MDFRNKKHERGSNWTDPEIVELLQLWSDDTIQLELESSLRNQRVFDRIARALQERGIFRTGDQCREKIKKMRLEYRRIKENHKTRSWKFFDVIDRVLTSRPSITYSSLGGTVVAQHVYPNQAGAEGFQTTVPASSFGPPCAGGFLFGHPLKPDALDIKCENVDESIVNSSLAPPEMYYGSGDDQETDVQSVTGHEEATGQEERPVTPAISPPGLSDVNSSCSATGTQAGSVSQERHFTEAPYYTLSNARPKKRKGAAKAKHGKASSAATYTGLDRALVNFLKWQQVTEERLLSLEEARLERELQAEERRGQREEQRAEQERLHELRLFGMLTATLGAGRGAPSAAAPGTSASHLGAEAETRAPVRSKSSAGGERSAYLSNRGNSIRRHQGILQEGFLQYGMDRYDQTDNPDGMINLGTSENKLCYDVLLKRLSRPDMLLVTSTLLQYGDWTGHRFLREEVARFLTDYCCSPRPLKADNVVVMNGCGSLFSCVATVICDPKDAILIPTPFYGVITEDLQLYADVKLFHVPLDCEENESGCRPFHLTVDKLEEGLKRAKQEGVTIRGVILMNPHNPLAEIYTQTEIIAFLEFAKRNELHVIVDEVYMLTVFDESAVFSSVLNLESLPDPERTHVMWGMSKDFAMAGIRIGTLYSENRGLVEALAQLGSFHGIPGPTQHQVAQLLRDREWIDTEFLPENRSRLKSAHSFLTYELQSLGIPFLDWPAALFVWADLRKYLREFTFEDELSLWRCFLRHKVVLSCGQAFSCSTPGWFRIVFAEQQHHLQLGLRRFKDALKEIEETHACPSSSSIKRPIESKSAKEDNSDSNNSAFVDSPRSKSPDALKENGTTLAMDELDSLIGTLRHQMRSSDWLQKNTPELEAGEDPAILDGFKALLQRARK
ncbi:1-aminocyclopropane-1-carboxylate synthase-like protein 1 [Eucyclogobius newberryi]|uniref:1-aminocyclopropane-1-carboxylate synthase-like protein 1 n=1 Tax=Eucyclogobius newberryi TaxID=166745 RepID=UPI003B5C4FC9